MCQNYIEGTELITEDMLKLESVGAVMDKHLLVYPIYNDNISYDTDSDTTLVDCCDEWYDNLSRKDMKALFIYLSQIIEDRYNQ